MNNKISILDNEINKISIEKLKGNLQQETNKIINERIIIQ